MKTRRVYFEGLNQIGIHVEDIHPKENEVLVKTHMASICGTDKNHLQGFLPNPVKVKAYIYDESGATVPYPKPVGHEGAGVIVEVGSAVTEYKVGDRVISFGTHITMSDYFTAGVEHNGHTIMKVPEGLTMDEASLGEPAACAIYAGMESGVQLGDIVLIVGAGFAGQCIAQTVKQMGAGKVIVCDLAEGKLNIAKALGADRVVNITTEDVIEVVKEETNGYGVDVAIEAAGTQEAIQTCTDCVKHGGIIGLYSWVLHPVNLIIDRWHNDGLDIRTLAVLHRIKHDKEWYQVKALSNIANGKINIKPLITSTYSLDEIEAAFDDAINNPESCKVMLKP